MSGVISVWGQLVDFTNLRTLSLDTVSLGVKTVKRPFRKFQFYLFSSRSLR